MRLSTQLPLFDEPVALWDERTTWHWVYTPCKYCGEGIVWMQESRGWVPYDVGTLSQHWGRCIRFLEE
jgi:hypothetical protein